MLTRNGKWEISPRWWCVVCGSGTIGFPKDIRHLLWCRGRRGERVERGKERVERIRRLTIGEK